MDKVEKGEERMVGGEVVDGWGTVKGQPERDSWRVGMVGNYSIAITVLT